MTRRDGASIPALKYPECVVDTFINSNAGGGERSFPFISLSESRGDGVPKSRSG